MLFSYQLLVCAIGFPFNPHNHHAVPRSCLVTHCKRRKDFRITYLCCLRAGQSTNFLGGGSQSPSDPDKPVRQRCMCSTSGCPSRKKEVCFTLCSTTSCHGSRGSRPNGYGRPSGPNRLTCFGCIDRISHPDPASPVVIGMTQASILIGQRRAAISSYSCTSPLYGWLAAPLLISMQSGPRCFEKFCRSTSSSPAAGPPSPLLSPYNIQPLTHLICPWRRLSKLTVTPGRRSPSSAVVLRE